MSSTTSSIVIDVSNDVINEVSNEVINEVSNEVSNDDVSKVIEVSNDDVSNEVSKDENHVLNEVSEVVLETNLVCNMCVKANRKDFNTHSVRDATGKVSCPYLLSIICRYCKTSGHTVSYCPVLKLKEQNAKDKAKTKTMTKPKPYSNGFISVNVSKQPPKSPTYVGILLCNMFASIDMEATVNDNKDIISKLMNDKDKLPDQMNLVLPLKYKSGTSWADLCDDCSSSDDDE